jgi:hypothetical protein
MAGGALGALVTGGDPVMAAATAGIAAGIANDSVLMQFSDWSSGLPDISIGDVHLRALAASSGVGALAGGVTAEIFGGNFGEGAMWGAAGAAAGYVVSTTLEVFFREEVYLAAEEDYSVPFARPVVDPTDVDWDILRANLAERYSLSGKEFKWATMDEAARAASEEIYWLTARNKVEYGGWICKNYKDGTYYFTRRVMGTRTKVDIGERPWDGLPPFYVPVVMRVLHSYSPCLE